MTTRRAFMQIAAASAAPMAFGGLPRLASSNPAHHLVVFEASLAPAGAFARRARSLGIATRAMHGDITDVWLGSVRPAWQHANASIAGLTTPAALFCLEQLAFAHGMRVVFHAEHVLQAGRVAHQVHRPAHGLTAAALDRAANRWPLRLADSLLNPRPPRAARPGPSLAALTPALPPDATLLTSWIIA